MTVVKKISLGELGANCYFVTSGNDSLVIDPGDSSEMLLNLINEFGAEKFKYILLTHGHFDHIGNTAALKKMYPDSKIVISEKEKEFTTTPRLNLSLFFGSDCEPFKADITVDDGDILPFGDERIKVMSTPGHTIGSVCYLFSDCLFSGDTLFRESIGRVDFPTGNDEEMKNSLKKLYNLPGNPVVYCGHDASTTLDSERKNNYAMRNCK